MIAKHRNRAILQATGAIILSVAVMILIHKINRPPRISRDWNALVVVLYIAAYVLWVMTSLSIARAKGYPRDFGGALFLIFIILGCCIPLAPLLFPFYIIFAMEDKTKERPRRHGR